VQILSRQFAANALGAAEKLPSDYKLYGAWRAGSTVEGRDFVDKRVLNSCSWNFLKKECEIGIFLRVIGRFLHRQPLIARQGFFTAQLDKRTL
jgi:hypothetical protein